MEFHSINAHVHFDGVVSQMPELSLHWHSDREFLPIERPTSPINIPNLLIEIRYPRAEPMELCPSGLSEDRQTKSAGNWDELQTLAGKVHLFPIGLYRFRKEHEIPPTVPEVFQEREDILFIGRRAWDSMEMIAPEVLLC